MIKFIINKKEASNKAKRKKGKTKVVSWEYKVLSPVVEQKCCRLIHTFGRRGRNLQSTRCVLGGK
jgi:hypothetical protein